MSLLNNTSFSIVIFLVTNHITILKLLKLINDLTLSNAKAFNGQPIYFLYVDLALSGFQ